MTAITEAFGASVRRLRDEQGLHLEELAAKAGVSATTIRHAEGGFYALRGESMLRIAWALNGSVDEMTAPARAAYGYAEPEVAA